MVQPDKTDPHLIADQSSRDGPDGLATLAAYFKNHLQGPRGDIIKTIAGYLFGDNRNWHLYLKPRRGGRPPKNTQSDSLWTPGKEHLLSHRLFLLGDKLTNSPIPDQEDKQLILELAEALDPEGSSKWRLAYSRPRPGNPGTPSKKEMRLIVLGQMALKIKAETKSWSKTQERLCELGLTDPDPSARIKAVDFVKSVWKKYGLKNPYN